MPATSPDLKLGAANTSMPQAHPVTWWVFGVSAAFLATTTTSAIQLLGHALLCIAIVILFQRSIKAVNHLKVFLIVAAAVVFIRIAFRIIFGGDASIWADVMAGATDGLRLAAIILSVAVANAMANPRRLLKHMPGALYELAAAISVALNLVPELISSLQRVRRASLIRGRSKGLRALKSIVIPVLEDSLERSMQLAASMSARGFGRKGQLTRKQVLVSRFASLFSLLCMIWGIFFLLTGSGMLFSGLLVIASICAAWVALRTASKVNLRTKLVSTRFGRVDYLLFAASAGLLVMGVLQ